MGDSTIEYPRYGGAITSLTDTGYGFIGGGEGEGDIFFHSSELSGVDFDSLRVGDKVGFDAVISKYGFVATNVGKNGSSRPFTRNFDAETEELIPTEAVLDVAEYGSVAFAIDNFSLNLSKIIAEHPEQIERLEWRDVERLVAQTFSGLGFDVELTPGSKDGGKDVVITQKDSRGARSYFVEIKHWKAKVGPGPVLEFLHVVLREILHAIFRALHQGVLPVRVSNA